MSPFVRVFFTKNSKTKVNCQCVINHNSAFPDFFKWTLILSSHKRYCVTYYY